MSLCINPACPQPQNSDEDLFCLACGTELLMEGRFRVLQMLGAGGCGKTYEVSDRSGGVKVLKVLSNNEPKYVELFQREALLLSHLDHPGIPSVDRNAYFTTQPKNRDEPLHCLVMEKIIGLDLSKYLRQRGQPIEQKLAWQWMLQLAQILKAIHHKHILHRDIKPSNIMLKADGNLALVDFGTARSITNVYENEAPVPATRIISALYTPDEQMKGHPVTQSDFFALGRTFIYLLTARDLGEFYDPLTAKFNWSTFSHKFSPVFVALIDHLIAPLPADRPASAEDIIQQLKAIESELFKSQPQMLDQAYAKTQVAHSPPPPPISAPPSQPNPPPIISGSPLPEETSGMPPPLDQNSGSDLTQDFLERCQRKLAESIGPIARIVCQQTQSQRADWTRLSFVEALSTKIQDPQAIAAFKEALL